METTTYRNTEGIFILYNTNNKRAVTIFATLPVYTICIDTQVLHYNADFKSFTKFHILTLVLEEINPITYFINYFYEGTKNDNNNKEKTVTSFA